MAEGGGFLQGVRCTIVVLVALCNFSLNAVLWGTPVAWKLYNHFNREVLCIEYRIECPDTYPDTDISPPAAADTVPNPLPPADEPDMADNLSPPATTVPPVVLPPFDTPAWWGTFTPTQPVTRWRTDGRHMQLFSAVTFRDRKQVDWTAPRGIDLDGASIPQQFWSIMGGPFEGKYRNASIIHDFFCCFRNKPWRDVHMVFYEGMRASEVDQLSARTMWGAVRYFGPRWEIVPGGVQQCVPVELPTLSEGDIAWFERFRDWLEGPGAALTIEDLDQLAAACDAIALDNLDGAISALRRSETLPDKDAAVFLNEVGCPAGDAGRLLPYVQPIPGSDKVS